MVNIEDSFWKLASPRIVSKNIMFNLKTEEDLMILSDFKRINKKMKVEGIILPNKLDAGNLRSLDLDLENMFRQKM